MTITIEREPQALFTLPHIIVAILTYWILATIYNFLTAPTPPTELPWMGYGKGWFAGFRNFIALTKSKEWLLAGYDKYNRNNKAFVLPATLGTPAEIIIPRSQMGWMFDQPDHVLSSSAAHYDSLQGAYSFVKPLILRDPYHEHVIHKNLVRNLNSIILESEEEVPFAVDQVYGLDTHEFKRVDVLQSFMQMIPILTNRLLTNETLCHEQKYLDAVVAFTEDCIRTQGFLHLVPKAFHSIVGNLLGLQTKYHYWLTSKFTLPIIKQRIQDITRKDAGDPEYKDWKEPSDFFTWSYRTAQAEGRHEEMQPDRIAQRIMPINFASIHTTALTAYETFTNIMSASPTVIHSLREEAHRILQEEGSWTKSGLTRMHRMDSCIRESQRASPIALTFIHRKVVAKEGITTPEGVHVKCGTLFSCPWTALAGDDDIHHRADDFDAFRYSRPREEYEAMTPVQKSNMDALKLKQTGLVTTAHSHLPFGHGRHACPGRFFVSHELKMLFAYLLLNYDIKPIKEKPKKLWVIRFQVPMQAHIEVRRRESMWTPDATVS